MIDLDPWRCQHGHDLTRCWQLRSGLGKHPDLCFYHSKIAAGLFTCSGKGCAKPRGHRPPCSSVPERRMTTTPDALFSDETQGLLRVLARESA